MSFSHNNTTHKIVMLVIICGVILPKKSVQKFVQYKATLYEVSKVAKF